MLLADGDLRACERVVAALALMEAIARERRSAEKADTASEQDPEVQIQVFEMIEGSVIPGDLGEDRAADHDRRGETRAAQGEARIRRLGRVRRGEEFALACGLGRQREP